MYISEVSGHHSATLAIEKGLRNLAPDTEIMNINAFNYTNPISEKIINRIYMGVIKRTPKIWDYLYDNPKVVKKIENIKNTIHKYNSPKLKTLFDKFRPDCVVCTQAFPCGMVADYKKTYSSRLPLFAVLTDYIPHSYWFYDTVDYYIIPSQELTHQMTKKGIQPHRIKPLGIPFDPDFNHPVLTDKIREKLQIQDHLPTILIMGGGQGLGPIKTIVKSFERINKQVQEIVIAGTNKRLFSSLKRKSKKYKQRIIPFGYCNNINELMSISDLIITKPGGITTAEALAKRLPMIIVRPIPGQETSNAQFLTSRGAAIRTDTPKEICALIEKLLNDRNRLHHMRESARHLSKPNASMDIARMILGM